MRNWTEKEIAFLRKSYNNVSIRQIEVALGRSAQSIRSKVHNMRKKGMTFDRKRDNAESRL